VANVGDEETFVPALLALQADRGPAGRVFGGVVHADVDGLGILEVSNQSLIDGIVPILVLHETLGGVWAGEEVKSREEVAVREIVR